MSDLKQLVIEAQQHAPQTADRQKVLIQLVDEILRSRKICRPQKGQPLSGVYLEIYQQLQQQLLHNIDQVIDKYNPQRTPLENGQIHCEIIFLKRYWMMSNSKY
jgi:hypothetical protein